MVQIVPMDGRGIVITGTVKLCATYIRAIELGYDNCFFSNDNISIRAGGGQWMP